MKKNKIREMAQLAILIAIMLIFAFTPLGYLKFGAVEMTLMVLPVAIGAIVLGPVAGAILGGVFGLTSFIQCFGASALGVFLLGVNPFFTFLTSMIPRILCGWLSGLLFRALHRIDRTRLASYFAASLSTALLNTVFFMGAVLLFFWHNDAFLGQMNSWGIATDSVWVFLVAFVGVNGVIEAAVNFVLAAAIAKAVVRFVNKNKEA